MAVKKTVAKVAKEEVNVTPVVETKEEVKETAKKPVAKKATAKSATAEKKETTTKAPAKKTAAKKDVQIAIQFADKNYTTEDLANIANDVWVYDYEKKASELKEVQLYVKPEESKVYYVFNGEIEGSFNI